MANEKAAPKNEANPAAAEAVKAAPAAAAAQASKPAAKPVPAAAPQAKAEAKPAAQPAVKAKARKAPKPAARKAVSNLTNKIVETRTKTVQTGAKTMTETMNKAQEATKQAAQQATEQFRGAINDANQRGKVAIEKSTRIVEEMADLTRGNMEALVASSKTAAKYVETLTQGAADYSRRSFEEASAALRSFAEVKSPTDFFRLQSDYARSAFDSMVAETARVSETVVKMSGDMAQPITSRYSVAAERMKAVAA